MGLASRHVRIEGRVQGVGYREWTRGTALDLGLAGWVRNRRDGSVEALFLGESAIVTRMLDLCREGPPAARVSSVSDLEPLAEAPAGFAILPTA